MSILILEVMPTFTIISATAINMNVCPTKACHYVARDGYQREKRHVYAINDQWAMPKTWEDGKCKPNICSSAQNKRSYGKQQLKP